MNVNLNPTQLVNETIGPLFVACIISTAYVYNRCCTVISLNFVVRLFGLTCAQSCLYFKRHAEDHTELKYIVSSDYHVLLMKLKL